jgi:hypothetical protein
LTIEYSSFADLRSQLLSLAQSINNQFGEALQFQPEAIPRRGPSTEQEALTRRAHSA